MLKRLMAWLAVLCVLAPASVWAEDDEGPAPFRGTGVTLGSQATALSFSPNAEPDFNPTVGMSVDAALMWWFSPVYNMALRAGFNREFTRSDSTSNEGEVVVGDVSMTFGASRLWTVPVLEIDISANLGIQAPTSPSSRARTMILGVSPGLSLRRGFDLLEGGSVGLGVRGSFFAHRFTTSERETPLIGDCVLATGGCEAFLNLGVRNVQSRVAYSADLGLGIVSGLGLSVSATVLNDFLYDAVEDDRVSFTPLDEQDTRFAIVYNTALSYRPVGGLQLRLGAVTAGAQRAADQDFRTPFFNRNTVLYFDLGFELSGIISKVTED